MEDVLFSIIIPCYNVEKYISRTIDSVLNQTFDNYEIILINDGSKDNTGNILDEYKKKENKIKVIHQENKGVSEARNIGVEKAQGKYVYFLDGDDFIEKELLIKVKQKFEDNIQMYSFGYKVIKGNKEKKYFNDKFNNNTFTSKEFLKKFLIYEINQSICSFIIEKKYLDDLRFDYSLRIGEDLDLQLKILMENNLNIYYDSHPYFHYLQRKNSSIKNKITLRDFDSIQKLASYKNFFSVNGLEKEFSYYIERRIIYFIKLIILNGAKKQDLYFLKQLIKKEYYNLKKWDNKGFKEKILFKMIFIIFNFLNK